MEDKKNGSYSAEGRKLRPRKKVSFESNDTHRSYGENRSYGERRDNGERRSYGERRDNNGERRSGYASSERRQYNGGRSFGSDNGERRSYGQNSGRGYGERRSSFSGEQDRRPYGDDRRSHGEGSERRQYGSRPYNNGNDTERRSYGSGERSYGERSYGERRQSSYGGSRSNFSGGSKPYQGRRDSGRGAYGKSSYGKGSYNKGGYRKKYDAQFDESAEAGINRMINRKPQLDPAQYSDNDYVKAPISNEVRLNKFIANSGVCSRREADTLIQAGVVTINGEVVTELGTKVNVLTDDVRFNGERLKGEEKVYIVMNKPKGYVTTSSDPHADKTVMDLIKGCDVRVFPVGRLDKATTGVLMFTNDGEIAERLTHPAYDKKKIYQVILDRPLSQEDFEKITSGVILNDGEVKADELEYIDAEDHRRLGIEIHSGKNRIVRRIFESLGYSVRALDRVYFAGLTKKGLSKGEWRYLSEGEVNILRMGAYV